jgi:6-pyruvoyltetrahydropterin/6-carboxytetrahydropterin synthase
MRLTRTYRFSASHRLHADCMSAEQNREVYGKCNNPYGHGHDYVLKVTVSGEVDAGTGRVVEPGRLDRYVHTLVTEVFDHKDMNTDVPGFEGVPTTENLVRDIERRLRSGWRLQFGDLSLHAVWVGETPRNTFELRIG